MDENVDNKINKDDKFVIFHIEGGHGKVCMATAVIRAIKKKYPDRKLIVVSAWDGPLFYNPNIFRFYTFNNMQYFYDDYVKADTIILRHDVYHTEDYILQRKHLVKSWCDMYDLEFDGIYPDIILNDRELEIAKDKIKPDGKPIMLLQTHGGSPNTQYSKKSWFRDMPIQIAQELVNHYSKQYRILHIKTPEQPVLNGVEPLTLPHRELYAVFPLSTKRVFIDSVSQHVAAGLGLESTVVWIGNKPEVFGYDKHINIKPNLDIVRDFNRFNYLDKYDISGQVQEFPYESVNMFNINDIGAAIEKQK